MLYEIFDVTHPYFKWKVILVAVLIITFAITATFDYLERRYYNDKYIYHKRYQKGIKKPGYKYFYKYTCPNIANKTALIFCLATLVYVILSIKTFNYWTLFKLLLCTVPYVIIFETLRRKGFKFWAICYTVAVVIIFIIGILGDKFA